MSDFTHINDKGQANMVDVTAKEETIRYAKASGRIRVNRQVLDAVKDGSAAKGDVLGTARIAGIMAAKRTPELIPLCHTLLLTKVSVDFEVLEETEEICCTSEVRLRGKTGAEMEALTPSMICVRPWIKPWLFPRSVWRRRTEGGRGISKEVKILNVNNGEKRK